MRIIVYPPMKRLDSSRPSGDLTTALGLIDFLERRGHRCMIVNRPRARWLCWRPWNWPGALAERRAVLRHAPRFAPHLWLTIHAYYKAPDLQGPWAAARLGLPYVIYKGMYSTKPGRTLRTWPGFVLNRRSLLAAGHVFSNRKQDMRNLLRLLPPDRVEFSAPGIRTADFPFDPEGRDRWRRLWNVGDEPVLVSAAMFRADVKTRSLLWLIDLAGRLKARGLKFHLAVAGDGVERQRIAAAGARALGDRFHLAGLIPRAEMPGFYSAGEVFAYPGFGEALGMVFLEAQSCGLPVAAMAEGGIPELVDAPNTGLLTPVGDAPAMEDTLTRLLGDPGLRRDMGRSAAAHVRRRHDLDHNLAIVESRLMQLAGTS